MPVNNKCHPTTESFILNSLIQAKKGVLSVVITDMLKDSSVQQRNGSVSLVISMDTLPVCVSRNKYLSGQEHTKHTSYKLKKCIHKIIPCAVSQKILPAFCLQVEIQCVQAESRFPTTPHLISNLAYKLKPHHKRNEYLTASLNTCTDVNIMPASVYKLVFCDPDVKKPAPSKLEIGTYTTDRVRLVGSCTFYLVHLDTKLAQ